MGLEKFYTVDELAEALGYHRETIKQKIYKGDIPAVKFGQTWRIPESALREMQVVTPQGLRPLSEYLSKK